MKHVSHSISFREPLNQPVAALCVLKNKTPGQTQGFGGVCRCFQPVRRLHELPTAPAGQIRLGSAEVVVVQAPTHTWLSVFAFISVVAAGIARNRRQPKKQPAASLFCRDRYRCCHDGDAKASDPAAQNPVACK